MKISLQTIYSLAAAVGLALVATSSSAQMVPPNQPDMPIDAGVRAEVIHALVKDLEDTYVFPDVADRLTSMLQKHLTEGGYDKVTSAKEFSTLLTTQMRDIAHDAHLQVMYSARPAPDLPKMIPGQPEQFPPGMVRDMTQNNFGFQEAKRLDGNIGYLKLTGFVDSSLAGNTLAGAMAFLANTNALIIDLRHNTGGAPTEVALLASYFFPSGSSIPLTAIEWRVAGTKEYRLQQSSTLSDVPGKRYVDKELYILTSSETPSAAEAFTYDLKALKRATVIGETTWGGANPGGVDKLDEHFMAFVPAGYAVNPITKTNWEGKGVEPDVKTSQADALRASYTTALQHLIDKTSDQRELMRFKQALANADSVSGSQGP
jgi:retinol-binding protein 3